MPFILVIYKLYTVCQYPFKSTVYNNNKHLYCISQYHLVMLGRSNTLFIKILPKKKKKILIKGPSLILHFHLKNNNN